MQYAPLTSWHIALCATILHVLENRVHNAGVSTATIPNTNHTELKAEIIVLRTTLRKVEAKILGHIEPSDWEKLNPDLNYTKEVLERVKTHLVLRSPWEAFENGLMMTAVQEVVACREALADQ